MTQTFSVREAQNELAQLLELAKAGNEILIADSNVPVARLSAIPSPALAPKARVAGLHAGAIHASDDFDEPLPGEFWLHQINP